MKFLVLALLGVCAVASAQDWTGIEGLPSINMRGDVLETIKAKVEQFIAKAKEDFNALSKKVAEIVEKVYEHILVITAEGRDKLEQIKADVNKKVDEMKHKGAAFKKCAVELEPEYVKIEEQTKADIRECSDEVITAYEQYRKDSEKDIAQIKKDAEQAGELIVECIELNPVTTVKCVYGKMSQFEKLIKDAMASVKVALGIARERATEVVKEIRDCDKALFVKAYASFKEVNSKLDKCYQESKN